MALLLHICCAPCSIYSWQYFERQGHKISGYFFNPNIHPYGEFFRRKDALQSLAEEDNKEIIIEEDYPLEDYLAKIVYNLEDRCNICYGIRLEQTAYYASKAGMDSFSTTLLLSPYQKHELLKEVGFKTAEKYGLSFLYTDLRPGFKESIRQARERDIYLQKYCGCIVSEKERYYNKGKHNKQK